MNKFFTKIAGLTLGLAMAIGVGVAIGGKSSDVKRADAVDKTDTINLALTGVSGQSTTYSSWSGKTSNSSAVYAGNSNGGANGSPAKFSAIGIRTNNSNSGIVSTTSGGTIKSITINFNTNTATGKTVDIYGKDTAYSAAADLYGNNKGDKLGSIVRGTSTSLDITGSYSYVGIRSNSGTIYINSITLVWEAASETCTVSFETNGGSTISSQTVAKGGKASAPANDPTKTNYEFDGWYTTGALTTLFDFANTTIDEDTTIYAKWIDAVAYNKVTSAPSDWSGTYLLVYEPDSSNGYIWTGIDDSSCYVSHSISNSSLKRDNGGASITIAAMTDGYSIKVNEGPKKGKYIGGLTSNDNGIQFSDSEVLNTISYSSSKTVIDSNSKHLTFSTTSGQTRFRYYKSSNADIQLYRKNVAYTIEYDSNGGSGSMGSSKTVVSSCTFTAPSGQEFDHWNTTDDDKGTSYNPGDSVSSSCTLYAIWRDLTPSVTLDKDSVSLTTAAESSDTVEATTLNITNPTYDWSRTAGDDCVTLTNATSATVTIASKGTNFANCTLTLTVNGTLGGKAITPIQKNVTVTVDKVPTQNNPYTVAEARYAIDNNKTINNVYVTGIVSQVDSFNNGAITYWISDDGSTSQQFEVYKGKNANAANFTSIDDVLVGDIVVVSGSITLYNTSTYEFSSGSSRVSYSRVTVTGIAVKTAPTKVAYVPGTTFDPTGLVITVTYSNSSTEDVTYNDSTKAKFSFDKDTITENCNVTITYAAQTCTQAVTILTVKNVTGVASALTEVYQGDPISGSDVTLNVLYSDDTTVGTVKADSVSVDTTVVTNHVEATATYSAASGTKTATFYVDVVKKPVWDYVDDVIDNAKTVSYLGTTGTTTWGDNFTIDYSSGSRYTIHSMGTNNTTNALQFNKNGYLYADRSGGYAYSISIKGTSGNKVNIFASNSAYSGEPTGDALEQLELSGSTAATYTFSSDYTYIAIHGVTAGTAIESVTIRWKVEGAEYPLTENPTLSPSGSASVAVGRNLSITVTSAVSGEHESDERLIISTSDPTKVSVSGSGKNFIVRGLAITTTPVTVTIGGIKGVYKTSISISVTEAVKTYDDKILTQASLGITSYDTNPDNDYYYDNVAFTCYNVMNTNGIQFKDGVGYISNKGELYNGTNNAIKSITLIMDANNKGYITAYEGTSANPSDVADLVGTWNATGVNTYQFDEGMTFFKLGCTGTTNVRKIIVELEDDANEILSSARLAALTILTDLSGICGDGTGTVSSTDWNNLVSDLEELNLDNATKNYLRGIERIAFDNLSQGGAVLENAMAHYDACIEKFGYQDVFGISQAESHKIMPILAVSKNTSAVIAIVVISAISAAAIGGYFLFRKKKED